MKNKIIPLTLKTILCVAVAGLFAGCSAMRPIDDAALQWAAYPANSLSHGSPVATVAGAAGGVLVSERRPYAAKTQADKAIANGYDKGKREAVKQQSCHNVSLHHHQNHAAGSVRLYPVQLLLEQRIDGVTFQLFDQVSPHRGIAYFCRHKCAGAIQSETDIDSK